MIPDYGTRLKAMVPSTAERKVYEALQIGLPPEFIVLHSVSWIARAPGDYSQDGEADFLLVHPQFGLLVLEIKGGGISFDSYSGEWTSRNRDGVTNRIKNPFDQAKNAKHQILATLRKNTDWAKIVHGPICIGHAVWLPDLTSTDPLVAPSRPREIILTYHDLQTAGESIRRTWDYSGSQTPDRCDLGKHGLALVEKIFARSFSVLPTAAARIDEEERQRIDLTETQFRVLKLLGSRRRVGIAGGAGTGKTLLAIEKAHQLARNGFKTLLLAYNSALGDHLATTVNPALPIITGSFHAFCTRLLAQHPGNYLARAQRDFPAQGNSDHWDIHLPAALCYLLEDHEVKFDAVIVDEAQDFADEFWFPLECMMADAEKSPLYLFYDTNQQLYRKTANFPIKPDEEFVLTENCRNTAQIHAVVHRFFAGGELNPPAISGAPVGWHYAESTTEQIKAIKSLVVSFTGQGGLAAQDIVILIADRLSYQSYLHALQSEKLTGGLQFDGNTKPSSRMVRVLTAAKFKGMEAPIVIVWGVDSLTAENARMELYVAFSRPKNELHVVGGKSALSGINSAG